MNKLTQVTLVLIAVLFAFAKPNAARAEANVRVYAASWCGYCKKLRADLKQETGTENRIRVDGVEAPVTWIDATKNKSIRGYPTTRISSEDGKLNEEVIGYRPDEIRAAIARVRSGIAKPAEAAAPASKASSVSTGEASKTTRDAVADAKIANEKTANEKTADAKIADAKIADAKIANEKTANGNAASTKQTPAKAAAAKASRQKLSVEKSRAKSGAPAGVNRLQYFDWFVVDDSGDQYCFETDADGNPLDPNESPVDPSICEQAYANAAAE